MNQRAPTTTSRAWGLELADEAAHLLCLSRAGAGYRLERVHQAALPRNWLHTRLNAGALAALPAIPPGEPLGVCFPDQLMLCREFRLPRTGAAALAKMVQAQAEALLAAAPGKLAWSWEALPDPLQPEQQWVLFCAVRQEALAQVLRGLPAGVRPAVLLPRALAGATAYLQLSEPAAGDLALVALGRQTTAATLIKGGRPLRCTVLDQGSETWQGHDTPDGAAPADPARRWAWELRERYAGLCDGLAGPQRPARVVLLSDGAPANGLADLLTPALGVPVGAAAPPRLDGMDGAAAPRYAALGAALRALAAPGPGINLAVAPEAPVAPRAGSWRRAALLLAAAGMVLVLWGALDVHRARRLQRQLDTITATEAASGGFERRLALARYLDQNNVTALAVLDAVSQAAPSSVILNAVNYQRPSTLRLSGMIGAPQELDSFLRQLQGGRLFQRVELRSARIDERTRQCSFEITAEIVPFATPTTAPAATAAPAGPREGPPAPVSPEGDRSRGPAPSRTAGNPTTAPASAPGSSAPGKGGAP